MKLLNLAIKFTFVQKVGHDQSMIVAKQDTKSSKSIKLMAAAEQLSAALQLFSHSCSYQ